MNIVQHLRNILEMLNPMWRLERWVVARGRWGCAPRAATTAAATQETPPSASPIRECTNMAETRQPLGTTVSATATYTYPQVTPIHVACLYVASQPRDMSLFHAILIFIFKGVLRLQ